MTAPGEMHFKLGGAELAKLTRGETIKLGIVGGWLVYVGMQPESIDQHRPNGGPLPVEFRPIRIEPSEYASPEFFGPPAEALLKVYADKLKQYRDLMDYYVAKLACWDYKPVPAANLDTTVGEK